MTERTVVLYQIGSNAAQDVLYYEQARVVWDAGATLRIQTFDPAMKAQWIMEGVPVGDDPPVKVADGEPFLDALVARYRTGSHMLVLDSAQGDEIPASLLL